MADVEQIFQDICGLPIRERLRLVERIARELATSGLSEAPDESGARLLGLFADDPDAVDEMMEGVLEIRQASRLRALEDDGAKSTA